MLEKALLEMVRPAYRRRLITGLGSGSRNDGGKAPNYGGFSKTAPVDRAEIQENLRPSLSQDVPAFSAQGKRFSAAHLRFNGALPQLPWHEDDLTRSS